MTDNEKKSNDGIQLFRRKPAGCEQCGKKISVGSVVGFNGEKCYCHDCRKYWDDETVLYYVSGKDTLKLVVDYNSFWQLGAGLYEIGSQDVHYGENWDNTYYFLDSKADCKSEEYMARRKASYLIAKQEKAAALLFPSYMVMQATDFFQHISDYAYAIEELENLVGDGGEVNTYFVVDDKNRVIGIAADDSVRRHWTAFWVKCEFKSKIVTWRELRESCKRELSKKAEEAALTPEKMLEYCQHRIQGQGVELKKAVYMVYKYMQSVRDGSLTNADNWLLTAPSGSGKTEFYRTIRDLFAECKIPIPVIQIDLSQITETGYKGDDVATIPRKILAQAPDMGGVCICFLDEADKKCRPSFGNNNVDNNAAAQANLLTLVEGIRTKLEIDKETRDFDSSKTMFVFMGAFQDVRNEKQERVAKSNMGFLSDGEAEKTVNAASDVFHDKLTMQDLIDYGMLEELAGRIMQVVNFKKLSKTDMRKLLTCKAEEISAQTGISIQLTGKALDELVKISYGSLGVRRPMNLIKEMALNTVATVFFDEGFDVDKDKVVIASEERAYVKRTRQADKVMSAG